MAESNEQRRQRTRRAREHVLQYLSQNSCSECGEINPAALEFHHRDGNIKKHSIANMVSSGYSLELLQDEINKCDVLCANCHRIQEARNGHWYKGVFEYD